MNEARCRQAQLSLIEALDHAAIQRGGDATLEALRDAVARYDFRHPLFRLLALKGFSGVDEFLYTFKPEVSALTTSEQFTVQLMAALG